MKSFFTLLCAICALNVYAQNQAPFGLDSEGLSSPTWVDIDGDGDLDAFGVAPGVSSGTVYYHENVGKATAPRFAARVERPFGLETKSLSSPTWVDIDGDGDFDAFGVLSGMSAGKVYYQENVGTADRPKFTKAKKEPFGLETKSLTSLTWCDIDGDGDMDAFGIYGNVDCHKVFYHKNEGTAEKPKFKADHKEPFRLYTESLSSLTFADLDGDGDLDVCGASIEEDKGTGFSCENIGTDRSPRFAKSVPKPFGLSTQSLTAYTFVDIDNNGLLDAFGVLAGTAGSNGRIFHIAVQRK